MNEFDIENAENYLEHYNVDIKGMTSRYISLINFFLTQSTESIHVNNCDYFKYIVKNGLDTITHVYRFLIMYTKNSELTCYNCKKAIHYYIEFICQMISNNSIVLKLNIKDASLFVYRKTIFAVDQNFRKDYKDQDAEKIIGNNLFYITEIVLYCFQSSIADTNYSIDNVSIGINRISIDILEMFEKTNSDEYSRKLICILKFCECINSKKLPDNFNILSLIVRKITIKNIDVAHINDAFTQTLSYNITGAKFVKLFFSKCVKC